MPFPTLAHWRLRLRIHLLTALRATALLACGILAAPAWAGDEFRVNTTTTDEQSSPSVAALAGGGFVVAWTDSSLSSDDPSGSAIRAQRFDASGSKVGPEFLVNTTTANDQHDPSVAALAGGGFVVVWTDNSQNGSDVRAQRFDANGSKVGTEFLVNTITAFAQYNVSVAALAGGGFVVTWTDFSQSADDTNSSAIRAQQFLADGSKSGSEFLVNTTTAGNQFDSRVAALAGGNFVITWDGNGTGDAAGIFARLFAPATKEAQTISITSTPVDPRVGGSYTVSATGGGSGNPVTFSIDSATAANCRIAGNVVSFTAAGSCNIIANQEGNASYDAAAPATQSLVIGKGLQAIAFTSIPTDPRVGGSYTVTATGGASGNPVIFSVEPVATANCSMAGNVVSFTAAGYCSIRANQAGNIDYEPAAMVRQSFEIGKGLQRVVFTSTPVNPRVGGSYTVSATGGASGNPVTFAVDPATAANCRIEGNVVRFTTEGPCTIQADQAGNANYEDALPVQQRMTVRSSGLSPVPVPTLGRLELALLALALACLAPLAAKGRGWRKGP